MTNLSTEQIIGINGVSFSEGLVPIAWEVFASVAMVALAIFFLPKYLTSGLTTIPEFLEHRFNRSSRLMANVLFLFGYVFVLVPIILYSGALAISEIFSVPQILNVSNQQSIWICVFGFGLVGSIYAIFGGLKVVAISDTLNGLGLIFGGLLIPYFGLKIIGSGDFIEGFQILKYTHPDKFDAIGGPHHSVPFSTACTGLILVSIFYWCTNQVIVQRVLAAKNLKEGQKGVLLAGFLKLFSPIIVVLPGIIAFHLFGNELASSDRAYPTLVRTVLPPHLVGFFAAVLVGSILSSFNSALNSASTLFSMGLYKKYIRPDASEKSVVNSGKIFCTLLAVIAMFVAPLTAYAPQGLFGYLQEVNGCYTIPILNVLLLGMLNSRLPPIAAKFGLIFGSCLYCFFSFVVDLNIHYLHLMFIIFSINTALMLIITKFRPVEIPWVQKYTQQVDIIPWRFTNICGFGIITLACFIYLEFSYFSKFSYVPFFFFFIYACTFILNYKKTNVTKPLNDNRIPSQINSRTIY